MIELDCYSYVLFNGFLFCFKAFDDMRQAVKKKFTVIRQHRNRTGESPIDIALNEADQKIVSICNINILDGNQNLDEIGVPLPNTNGIFFAYCVVVGFQIG